MTPKEEKAVLSPCPFCGQEASVWFDDNADQTRWHHWRVGCRHPGLTCAVEPQTVDEYKTKEEAIAVWNRRARSAPGWVMVPREMMLECRNRISHLWEKERGGAFTDLAIFLGKLDTILSDAPDAEKAKP